MITRGFRILLVLSFLWIFWPCEFGRAERNMDDPTLSHHFYLPVILLSDPIPEPAESCTVIDQSPPDNAILQPGTVYDMRWMIKNTTGATWRPEVTWFRFLSGDRLQQGRDVFDLPSDVLPGSAVNLVVPMRAPKTPGTYAANWVLIQEYAPVCKFHMIVKVQ